MELSQNETAVLEWLLDNYSGNALPERDIRIEGIGEREVASALSYLERKSLISTDKIISSSYELGAEGEKFLKEGLPERRLYDLLVEHGSLSVADIFRDLPEDGKVAITQLSQLGIKPRAGKLTIEEDTDREALEKELSMRARILGELREPGNKVPQEYIEKFRKRGSVLIEKKSSTRLVTPAEWARKELERNQGDRLDMLTPELIASGEWKGKTFRSYDLNSTVGKSDSGFLHPITLLVKRIREIFLSMGFTEMKGHYIEYAGWNMDALFIPQGHPARELQDTFYLETEREGKIEHPEVMGILKKTHESGMPGYTGWGYSWSQDEAKRQLLRTHTTVSTIRYLYEHPEAPQAVFSVDKVFRHESVDWKHLAELYQIEGAVCSKDANLSTLKWIIREFYSRLGFEDLKFIPSYYPYTEPSIDTVAVIRGKEVELGGSGIFRPEVTKPLGIKEPVMAWGLGLERLAMLYYGLDDIREIYQSDIDWLRTFRIKL
ncbi:MAG: phenylalanine--tRNA ligase subunit alpha [Candidatus Thermoplasmatota archaeon]|nr:phenylalanine--tRNA ligase subunit alpha [Candidatus Thermoplasmatota archaeon]